MPPPTPWAQCTSCEIAAEQWHIFANTQDDGGAGSHPKTQQELAAGCTALASRCRGVSIACPFFTSGTTQAPTCKKTPSSGGVSSGAIAGAVVAALALGVGGGAWVHKARAAAADKAPDDNMYTEMTEDGTASLAATAAAARI